MTINSLEAEHYLLEVKLKRERVPSFDQYPFSLPGRAQPAATWQLHPKVTFIIGENGSGKSTLLEAIAVAWGFNPEGGSKNFRFSTRRSHSELNEYLTLVKGIKRPRDGYFLRAESFFNVATEIEGLDEETSFGPPDHQFVRRASSLHEQSHGESFFSLHDESPRRPRTLHVFDEPEAALSPDTPTAMIARLHQLVQSHSQFIIATHSPLLMAYPNARIHQINGSSLDVVEYEETEHYLVARSFLDHPRRYLETIMS
jgi:predicted ATPase